MIGQNISHYKVLDKLGEGGMGVVYKAYDTKLNRTVALKFLPPKALYIEEDKKRINREAQAAASIIHPNIATVYEIDESEGLDGESHIFIAMEFIDGKGLDKKVASGPVKIQEVIDIGIQIAEGLQAKHEKGLVHRDIKSSNVMVTEKGQVKLMDFGLAKLKDVSVLTKEGITLGTIPYMSPEQALGEAIDHRTDIWSLGVILYEMITGTLPFKGDYSEAVIYQIINQEPEPVTSVRFNVPMELERIIKKAIQKDRESRYLSIGDMIVDLRSLKKQYESGLRGESQVRRGKRNVKSKYIYTAIPLITILILVAIFYFFPKDVRANSSIAVLPLDNLSGDPEQEYFAEGLTDALITELGQISSLRVISRTSIKHYKKTEKSLPDIAKELNADLLVEGSVLKSEKECALQLN